MNKTKSSLDKEIEEYEPIYMARYESGFPPYEEEYWRVARKTVNLQLRYWVEALMRFEILWRSEYKPIEELIIILNFLCLSLEALGGANIKPEKKAPSLRILYSKKHLDLESEKPTLFKELDEMVINYNNICKHFNRSPERKRRIQSLNSEKIRKYMITTQNIWHWVLKKVPARKAKLDFFKTNFMEF